MKDDEPKESNKLPKIEKIDKEEIKMRDSGRVKLYDYECLNLMSLQQVIYEGTESVEFELLLKNNGFPDWPPNQTKLIFDPNILLIILIPDLITQFCPIMLFLIITLFSIFVPLNIIQLYNSHFSPT